MLLKTTQLNIFANNKFRNSIFLKMSDRFACEKTKQNLVPVAGLNRNLLNDQNVNKHEQIPHVAFHMVTARCANLCSDTKQLTVQIIWSLSSRPHLLHPLPPTHPKYTQSGGVSRLISRKKIVGGIGDIPFRQEALTLLGLSPLQSCRCQCRDPTQRTFWRGKKKRHLERQRDSWSKSWLLYGVNGESFPKISSCHLC